MDVLLIWQSDHRPRDQELTGDKLLIVWLPRVQGRAVFDSYVILKRLVECLFRHIKFQSMPRSERRTDLLLCSSAASDKRYYRYAATLPFTRDSKIRNGEYPKFSQTASRCCEEMSMHKFWSGIFNSRF